MQNKQNETSENKNKAKIIIRLIGFFNENLGDQLLYDAAKYILSETEKTELQDKQIVIHNELSEAEQALIKCDFAILLGGGLCDDTGTNQYYINQFEAENVKDAKRIGLGIGINPIIKWETIMQLRSFFSTFERVLVRDEDSFHTLVLVLKYDKTKCFYRCDLANILFHNGSLLRKAKLLQKAKKENLDGPEKIKIIIVNPTYFSWINENYQVEFYRKLLIQLNLFFKPERIFVIPFHYSREAEFCSKIIPAGDPVFEMKYWVKDSNVNQMRHILNVFGQADFIVASRFHATMIAMHLDIPFLSLAYNTKINNLIRESYFKKQIGASHGFYKGKELEISLNYLPFGNGIDGSSMLNIPASDMTSEAMHRIKHIISNNEIRDYTFDFEDIMLDFENIKYDLKVLFNSL